MRLVPTLSVLMALVACQAPRVGLEAARARLDGGDLLGALVELDSVPPQRPDYAEARSLAIAVERRIRTSQRLFARGLALRAQWQDEEAVRCFELAQEVWPEERAAASMIEATRHRMAIVAGVGGERPVQDAGAVAETRPVALETAPAATGPAFALDEPPESPIWVDAAEQDLPVQSTVESPGSGILPPSPLGETRAPPGSARPEPSTDLEAAESDAGSIAPSPPSPGAEEPATVSGSDVGRASLDIGAAESALQDGRLDEALRALQELFEARSGSKEVRDLLVRVLHQRALLHYGQGELARAIEVWGRVLDIDPSHAQATEFREAARSELDALRRR